MSFEEERELLEACVDRYAHLRALLVAAVDTGMTGGELHFKRRSSATQASRCESGST
jgi:hypothetical protein